MDNFLFKSGYDIAGLHEVLDNAGRPLCLMRPGEIIRQNLFHKSVGLLLRDNRGRALLSWRPEQGFGFSSFGLVPAGLGTEEYALALLRNEWGRENLGRRRDAAPRKENNNSHTVIYEAPVLAAAAENIAAERDKYLLADDIELAALIRMGEIIEPKFASIFSEYIFGGLDGES